MRMYDLIERKKHGGKLSRLEIHEMVQGFVQGEIPDYQMAAMLMAVYFKGMDQEETLGLTLEMASSGDMVDTRIRSICSGGSSASFSASDAALAAIETVVSLTAMCRLSMPVLSCIHASLVSTSPSSS